MIEFRSSLVDSLWIRGYWDDRLKYAYQTLEASERINDKQTLALCMVYDISWTFIRRGDFHLAKEWIEKGEKIFENLNDSFGLALSLRNLGNIAAREKKIREAEVLYKESLKLTEEANLNYSEEIRVSLGYLECLEKNDHIEALKHFEIAKELFLKKQNEMGYSTALFGIALTESRRGNIDHAKKLFLQSLDISKRIGRRDQTADILYYLALEEEKSNNLFSALRLVKEAQENYDRLGIINEVERAKEVIERLERKFKK